MKKFFLFALLAVVMAACGNDDEPETANASLYVKELVGFVGKSTDYVKANIKGATLENESGSLGKTTLRYSFPTNDVRYSLTFKSNTSGEIASVDVYGQCAGYDKGIELFKSEVDKINTTIPHDTYIARYNNGVTMDFSDRSEFWSYVAEHGVSKFIQETWGIENTATIKFDVEATYTKSSNAISIEIERKEW